MKLKYTNQEHTSIQVTTDTTVYTAPWPCHTWHATAIQEAIDSGTIIEDWQTQEEILKLRAADIKGIRDQRMQSGGFPVLVDGVTKWFHSDTASRSQQLALAQAGASIPTGLMWKTMDGTYVTMTSELAQLIIYHAIMQESATYMYAETLLADSSLDYTLGWPAIYGEV